MTCAAPKLLLHTAITAFYLKILDGALLVPPPPPPPPPENEEGVDDYMKRLLSWQEEMLSALEGACG